MVRAAACTILSMLLVGCAADSELAGPAQNFSVPVLAREPASAAPAPPPDAAAANEDAGALEAAYVQRPGDPAEGYRALLNENYLGCGVPMAAYRAGTLFNAVASADKLPGRTGTNAELPYSLNAFKTVRGVEVVNSNCLLCHASRLNGELVIGLGASTGDFTRPFPEDAKLLRSVLFTAEEQFEFDLWFQRVNFGAPFLQTRVIGVSSASRTTDILFAHRDPKTLTWTDEASVKLDPKEIVVSDIPPLWHLAKKKNLYYTGGGKGDHARMMMTASALCTDTLAEAERIDAFFPHIRAFFASLVPPPYPREVDAALAADGAPLFTQYCTRCHGSYGAEEQFPGVILPVAEIGTDSAFADGTSNTRFVTQWYAASFFGMRASLEITGSYAAPPLDGVWATAPYLHNGSVPTLATLLESDTRPRYWTRSFDTSDLDYDEVGFRYQRLASGQEGMSDLAARARIYDTTLTGHGNQGHTFGDVLSARERMALLEYLKTL